VCHLKKLSSKKFQVKFLHSKGDKNYLKESEMPYTFKYLSYAGAAGSEGNIVYVTEGENIYFSGVNPDATSTINAAEIIIGLLVKAEGVLPYLTNFFDIQTHRAYPGKQPGTFAIDRLRLQSTGDNFTVKEWVPVAMSDDLIAQGLSGVRSRNDLPGVPESIMEAFRRFIEE
jgi:hypothetical protein